MQIGILQEPACLSQRWSPNKRVGHIACIITGAGAGQERRIIQNTVNSLVQEDGNPSVVEEEETEEGEEMQKGPKPAELT